VDEAAWMEQGCTASGVPLMTPKMSEPPGDKDESEHPWGVLHGEGFTLGLPPGVKARMLDGAYPGKPIPGGRAWLRGRFVDSEGTAVAIGDARRPGYVAERPLTTEGEASAPPPPAGAIHASTLLATDLFETAAAQTGARSVKVQRWREQGFAGEWLVFRLELPTRAVEIGLPVLEGRRSPSLFWIPATWRPGDKPPAAPPIDAAERFGIRYERLSSLSRDLPWVRAFLVAPGMKLSLPEGWRPATTLRSTDGFPVQLVDGRGVRHGNLSRLSAEALGPIAEDWKPLAKPGARGAASAYTRDDGACLLVARDGHAYLLEPAAGKGEGETWGLVAASMTLSPIVRPKRKGDHTAAAPGQAH
jgi:hypothetical protein